MNWNAQALVVFQVHNNTEAHIVGGYLDISISIYVWIK